MKFNISSIVGKTSIDIIIRQKSCLLEQAPSHFSLAKCGLRPSWIQLQSFQHFYEFHPMLFYIPCFLWGLFYCFLADFLNWMLSSLIFNLSCFWIYGFDPLFLFYLFRLFLLWCNWHVILVSGVWHNDSIFILIYIEKQSL